jgi:hypothetical protein
MCAYLDGSNLVPVLRCTGKVYVCGRETHNRHQKKDFSKVKWKISDKKERLE